MKKIRQDYIKIMLTIAIIVGLFMPYISQIIPIEYLFENGYDLISLLSVTIPVLVVVPYLLFLIFKDVLKNSALKTLKVILLILYIAILGDYCYLLYDTIFHFSLFIDYFDFSFSIVLSLTVFLSSLKYSITKLDFIEHVFLSVIALPIILYFSFILSGLIGNNFEDAEDIIYGFYIMNGSFITLYIMAIYDIYKNRNIKNEVKTKEIIT